MVGTSGELQLLDGGFEQAIPGFVESAMGLDFGRTDACPELVEGSEFSLVPPQP